MPLNRSVSAKDRNDMITRWLHLAELGGDPWVLPIWAAANEAVRSGRFAPLPDEVHRIGLHVSTRLNILLCVSDRINAGTSLLFSKVKAHRPEDVSTAAQEGYAYRVDDDLKYSLLADIDTLLFELNSACELMTRLFGLLHAHVGQPIDPKRIGKAIGDLLAEDAQSPGWFVSLDRQRNFFMHEGAPYLAVDLSMEPETFDLLFMKENVQAFTDPETFVSLSEINTIVQGFIAAKQKLQEYLVSLFK